MHLLFRRQRTSLNYHKIFILFVIFEAIIYCMHVLGKPGILDKISMLVQTNVHGLPKINTKHGDVAVLWKAIHIGTNIDTHVKLFTMLRLQFKYMPLVCCFEGTQSQH